jgi:protein SCO1/2
MRRARTALACLLLCAPLAGCRWLMEDPGSSARSAAPAPRADRRSLFAHPWVWTDDGGRMVQLSRWRGETLVLTLAFTSCRETCPRTIQALRELDARFRRERRAARFVVVTLDPARDTPERLREFRRTERLPDSWQLLVGSAPATRALSDLLGVHVVDLDSHVMHDSAIVMFDGQGRATRRFTGWNLDHETPLL